MMLVEYLRSKITFDEREISEQQDGHPPTWGDSHPFAWGDPYSPAWGDAPNAHGEI